jgi:hypothetical protein
MDNKIVRPLALLPKIILIDGLTGTGKSMLGPLLGSLERIELYRVEHHYEYLCILNHLGKITSDAAASMLSMYGDLAVYNSMIGRETNFRKDDLSGVWSNPYWFRYLKRLMLPDGDSVRQRILDERPMIQVSTHQAMPAMQVAFQAFGKRLEVIEMVRHPLYLLEHWVSYIDRHGTDVRDFTIWFEHKGKSLPWFAYGWEDQYLASPPMDRVIYSIDKILAAADRTYQSLTPDQKQQVIEIPFEGFVVNPDKYIQEICRRLETEPTKMTPRVMKDQRLPRERVMGGPAKAIYKRYAWRAPDLNVSERAEFESRRDGIKKQVSPAAFDVLMALCSKYEAKYGLWFN